MFQKIDLKNFRHFQHQILELGPGLWCILGENGVGKSTIIECLSFMMYGSKQIRGKVSSSVSSKTSVHIEGDFPQEFTLSRVGNQSELRTQGSVLTRTADIKEYFEGSLCSAEVFTTVFVAHQRVVSEIAILRPGERKRRLCELLGLVAVERASEVLRKKVKDLRKPLVSEEQIDKRLEEAAFLEDVAPADLMKVRELQNELNKVLLLPLTPAQAAEKLRELSPLLRELQDIVGSLSGEICFKREALTRFSTEGTCILCGTKLQGTWLKEHLEKDIASLEAEVQALNRDKVTPLFQQETFLSQVASYRSSDVITKELGSDRDLDVDTLWPKIVDASQERSRLKQLQDDWLFYNEHKSDLELGLHFQEFLPYVMAERFRRLEELVEGYLKEYSPFRSFRLDDEGNMFVDDKSLKELSVGQCDLTCLIFRVALAQMFGEEQFGKPPIAIFDSSFDAVSQKNMALGLELLADAPFRQVIVTSHNEEVARRLGLNTVTLDPI